MRHLWTGSGVESLEQRLCLSVSLAVGKMIGSTATDAVTAIAESGGDRIVGGVFSKTIALGTRSRPLSLSSSGKTDGFVASYQSNGKLNWAFALGGTGNDRVDGIAACPGGGFVITGSFEGRVDMDPGAGALRFKSSGGLDLFVGKFSTAGEMIFMRQMGGSRNEHGGDISVDSDGAILTSGTFGGKADFDPSRGYAWIDGIMDGRIFVSKLSADGKYVWAKSPDDDLHLGNDVGRTIATDASGNIYVAGDITTKWDMKNFKAVELHNAYVAKYASDGTIAWRKTFLGGGDDTATALAVDSSGNSYVTGVMRDNLYADSTLLKSSGDTDAFLLKLSNSGSVVWATQMGGTGADRGEAIQIATDGNIYCSGSFAGSADFAPGKHVFTLRSAGGTDAYLASYSPAGDLISANQFGAAGSDTGLTMVMLAPNNNAAHLLWGGQFAATMNLNIGGVVTRWRAAGLSDGFWAEALLD